MTSLKRIIILGLFLMPMGVYAVNLINAKDGLFNEVNRFKAVEEMENNLEKAFNAVCEDVFCEGEFSRIKHIALNCFYNGDDSMLDSCHWDFAGSYAYADGDVVVKDARAFQCEFKPEMRLMDFADQVNRNSTQKNADPMKILKMQINSKGESIYDGLTNCL